MEKNIQTPMAQDRFTKIISMVKWIRTGRLPIKNSLFSEVNRLRVVQVQMAISILEPKVRVVESTLFL